MKPATTLAVVVFSIVSLVQFLRAAMGWPVTIDGFAISIWASVVAGVIAAALAFALWREARR